jgi:hypothetical protein
VRGSASQVAVILRQRGIPQDSGGQQVFMALTAAALAAVIWLLHRRAA